MVCVSLRGGGTERIICRLANHLSAQYRITIITLSKTQPFYELDNRVSVAEFHESSSRRSKFARIGRQLFHLFSTMRREKPDLCMIFGEDIAGAASLIIRLAGIGHIWAFFRGTFRRSLRGLNGTINPWALRVCERIFVQTADAKSALARAYGSEKLFVWPNPIVIRETVPEMNRRERLILNVGSIGRLKNQLALLRIFGRLESKDSWQLKFVGDGPERKKLEEAVSQVEANDSVTVAGESRNIGYELERSSIFAFTSLSEGFPNALAEALASGCACIAYDCASGPAELIENGVNGYLVETESESEYAVCLQTLVDDPGLRADFAHKSRESMERFEASRVLERMSYWIEEALTEGAAERSELIED